jgi:hypothetical protein
LIIFHIELVTQTKTTPPRFNQFHAFIVNR